MFKNPLILEFARAARYFILQENILKPQAKNRRRLNLRLNKLLIPKRMASAVLSLIKTAMADEKYESYIEGMDFLQYNDTQKFQEERQNVRTIKLEGGKIICLREDGDKTQSRNLIFLRQFKKFLINGKITIANFAIEVRAESAAS